MVASYTTRLNGDYDLKMKNNVQLRVSRNFATDLLSIKPAELSLLLKIASDMKIGIKPDLKYTNAEGDETFVPLTFPDGLKSLFIIQDITSQLI
jgi:hypothetical protein